MYLFIYFFISVNYVVTLYDVSVMLRTCLSYQFVCLLQVFEIIVNLPRIVFLNLSDNPLSHSDPIVIENVVSCSSVHQLVLNTTKISWETVVKLLTLFPE